MNESLRNALHDLTSAVNLATGIIHPNDLNRAKETFNILHAHRIILLKGEIEAWALANGWQPEDADALGSLAQQIGNGANPNITGGPWWAEGIFDRWGGRNPQQDTRPGTNAF